MAIAQAVEMSSTRESLCVSRINEMEWASKPKPGGVPGGTKKILSLWTGGATTRNPEIVMQTMLNHIPPWWHDPELVYHPCVEEAFIINGEVGLGDRRYGPGCYVYRPPGILHGPALVPSDTGATLFHRFAAEGGLLRYSGSDVPYQDSQPVTDEYKAWPIQWVEHVDSATLPWIDIEEGPWAGTSHKWLSRNRETGGGTVVIRIPAAWSGVGSPTQGAVEEFVLEGSLTAGGQYFERWGYASRRSGEPAGHYSSAGGAEVICVWDENELT